MFLLARTFIICGGAFWFLCCGISTCKVLTILLKNLGARYICNSSTIALLKDYQDPVHMLCTKVHYAVNILRININSMYLTKLNQNFRNNDACCKDSPVFSCVFRVSAALTTLIRWILRISWPFMKLWTSRRSPSLRLASR